ncbi:YdbC family protein [Metabacillus iocasae]|uniref:Transcriptional coactivator p15 (PC4) C-terminal domain-containing protein n=1 Tax=Priestia iocasae TaxID=2291674 RepID=A0ABS2QTX6_9BACI|nr:PC4/YdbC family ssDNA-binding protein [Metabacillus iocasae]MBM7702915.1 hypothetical protein [Metabacillus iocasae]
MPEIKYEIVETIAVLSESPKGWKKELNLVSWNGREPKYDLREWIERNEVQIAMICAFLFIYNTFYLSITLSIYL